MYRTYPVYYPSERYAWENGEIGLWRESHSINENCRDFINQKASAAYHGRALPGFIGGLTDEYGLERAMYVIGRTVAGAGWDGRYDRPVKERAARFGYQDMEEGMKVRDAGKGPDNFRDRTAYITSDVHPCILNSIFRGLMEMEQERADFPQADVREENCQDGGEPI